ncbi:hypothetical protein Plec18167_001718 [Paecilomyces lecythidis]|uniref:Alpha/beta hydrolase fold-3 domain-containing protein n=1 Tax=Paecilomyces lecythidis TaxID=3004212 RepID=A0ABR3Y9U1_9EURO
MSHKEYVYKKVEGGQPLEASVWYKQGGSDAPKPIEKLLELGFGAVVSPNYRLGPTISAQEGPVQDAKDSYLWSQEELPSILAKEANIQLDGSKIVAFGHSAGGTLALLMASLPQKPLAIIDIFGLKYFDDAFYHNPNPAFAKIPDFEETLLNRVRDDVPAPNAAAPPGGPNGPDFSNYRVAWLFTAFKKGSWLSSIQPDGNYDAIDPSKLFSPSFPPTYFIHGNKDTLVDVRFAKQASEELNNKGVETKLVIEEAPHGFDMGSKPGEHRYNVVTEGFKFLASHAI